MKLPEYSPPHGGWPQELPEYYRYPDGTVRTDLREISHEELISLGWSGPHERPISRIIENVEKVEGSYNQETNTFTPENSSITETTSGWISRSGNGIFSSATFNPEDNTLELPEEVSFESGPAYFITTFTDSVPDYDYDPEIERWEWDDSIRQYVIINLLEEALNRPVPPTEPPKPQLPPDWDNFETIILQSTEIRDFISYAATQNPLVASTFPAAFFESKNGKYNSFKIVWNELIRISPVNKNVILAIIGVAQALNLPQQFISIIEDTIILIDSGSDKVLTKAADWNRFERIVLQSEEMRQFMFAVSQKNALVTSAFTAAFYEVKHGNFNSFRIVWEELTKLSPVDTNVVMSFIAVATAFNLPEEFISIIRG
jgi:hypothetical protein